jgi:hypothetical protein
MPVTRSANGKILATKNMALCLCANPYAKRSESAAARKPDICTPSSANWRTVGDESGAQVSCPPRRIPDDPVGPSPALDGFQQRRHAHLPGPREHAAGEARGNVAW